MNPINIPGANVALTKPRDWDEEQDGKCETLRVWRGEVDSRTVLQSAWQPTPEEIEKLKSGHYIVLCVYGRTHPPVWISVSDRPKGLQCEARGIHEGVLYRCTHDADHGGEHQWMLEGSIG